MNFVIFWSNVPSVREEFKLLSQHNPSNLFVVDDDENDTMQAIWIKFPLDDIRYHMRERHTIELQDMIYVFC